MGNRATHWFSGVALAALAVVAAPSGCGGASNGYGAFTNSDAGSVVDATNQNQGGSSGGSSSSGSSGGDDASDTCTPSCNTDSDCQSTCAALQNGGVECCDQSSHTCFANQSGSCPAGNDGGGE